MDFSFITESGLINNLLIFLLIFIIVFQILRRVLFKDNKVVPLIVSLAIAILSVWYMSQQQIAFFGSTYSTIGTIALIALPAIIVFFFMYTADFNGIARKALWTFYSLISIYIFNVTSPLSQEINTEITLTIIIIAAIILLFDKSIKEHFIKKKIDSR